MPFLSALLCWFSTLSYALEAEPNYSSADFAKLVKITSPFVNELTEPVTTYNWHSAEQASELKEDSRDESARVAVRKFISTYWSSRVGARGADYGKGLFLARDPVITRKFGGEGTEWVLTEVKLRKRTRILDAREDTHPAMSEEERLLLNRLGCPMDDHEGSLGHSLVRFVNSSGKPKCAALIQHLLSDVLKVDLLAYVYDSAYIPECGQSDKYYDTAFIMMSGDRLPSEDVRVYNHKTIGDDAERIRIQSFFAKSRLDLASLHAPQAAPTTLTGSGSHPLLWKDLEGKPYDRGLSEWIKKNIFACGKPPQMMSIDSANPSETSGSDSGDSSFATGADSVPAP